MRTLTALLCLAALLCPASPAHSQEADSANVWMASYEMVWSTVNEHHYDPTFGGLDWAAIREQYRALVADVVDRAGFVTVANRMLGELKLSHYSVFDVQEQSASGSPQTSGGDVGIALRLLGGRCVIISVRPGSAAAEAGLRPGHTVESIDGTSVAQILGEAETRVIPQSGERRKFAKISRELNHRCYGDPGAPVALTCLDASGAPREVTLVRGERPGRTILSEALPPFYVTFEARRIPGDIAYVAFSTFLPPVDERFAEAIDSLGSVRGLVIDIRGNPGGMHEVGEAIAARLIQQDTLFSVFRSREGREEVIVSPADTTYTGPVVVLVDGLNASASERFTACLQSIGRAVVVGERSSGSVGPSDVIVLPCGASFMYLVAQSLTPDGTVLEGHGVIPDQTVELDPQALLAGRDTQLERALAVIEAACAHGR